jgi:hypothetical protein
VSCLLTQYKFKEALEKSEQEYLNKQKLESQKAKQYLPSYTNMAFFAGGMLTAIAAVGLAIYSPSKTAPRL